MTDYSWEAWKNKKVVYQLKNNRMNNQLNTTIPNYMASSVDSTAVSARITGLVLAGSSIIILLASKIFGVTLSANDIVSLATELGIIAGAIWTLKGSIIWLMTKFGTKTPNAVTVVAGVAKDTILPPESQTA